MVECALCELARLVGGDTQRLFLKGSGSIFCTAASTSFRESDRAQLGCARVGAEFGIFHARHPTPQRGRGAKTNPAQQKNTQNFFFHFARPLF
jgi:hypothetical protein